VVLLAAQRWSAGRLRQELLWQGTERLDAWVARRLEPCDVLHGLSSWCLHSAQTARTKFGALIVYDRGSAHLAYESRLLAEEAAAFDVHAPAMDPRFAIKDAAELAQADVVLLPSQFAARTFRAAGVARERIAVVPLAVDLRGFSNDMPVPPDGNALFVGRVGLGKGFAYLIKALQLLSSKTLKLTVLGPIERGFDEILKRLPLPASIDWRGTRPKSEVARAMRDASFLVLPSICDGFGLVVAQAMAAGRPVIVTENVGASELVSHGANGYIVPIRSPNALAEFIGNLAFDQERRTAMGTAARKRVEGLGGWPAYAQQVRVVYSQALRNHA
jgi:glycosyltransferase involved in cell wall biosynthesis